MQRRSTKLSKADLNCSESSGCPNKCVEQVEEVNKCNQHENRDFMFKNPIVVILKYICIIIICLPWIFQISIRLKQNDIISKLQNLIEDSFSCPKSPNVMNTTCMCANRSLETPNF